MSDQKNNRKKWLHIRLTDLEYEKLFKGFSSSTKRKFSDYARDLLLDKPITVYTRDQTLEKGVQVLGELKRELSAIGNNFNQAVKRIHIEAGRGSISSTAKDAEKFYGQFVDKTDTINNKIQQIFRSWLQE